MWLVSRNPSKVKVEPLGANANLAVWALHSFLTPAARSSRVIIHTYTSRANWSTCNNGPSNEGSHAIAALFCFCTHTRAHPHSHFSKHYCVSEHWTMTAGRDASPETCEGRPEFLLEERGSRFCCAWQTPIRLSMSQLFLKKWAVSSCNSQLYFQPQMVKVKHIKCEKWPG